MSSYIEYVRVPGFCLRRLAFEAWMLLETIAVRLAVIRQVHQSDGRLGSKLDSIERLTDELNPLVRAAMVQFRIYETLDRDKLSQAVLAEMNLKGR